METSLDQLRKLLVLNKLILKVVTITVYNCPVLDTIDEATLGVWIGPINTGVSGVADDDYLMSDDPVTLQGLMDIAEHFGNRYRITCGA